MALSFTLEPTFYGDFTMDNLNSRQLQIVHGYFEYGSISSTALTVTASMVGLNRILGFTACCKGDVFFNWDPGTATLEPVSAVFMGVTTTGVMMTFSSTASSSITSITSIPFLCWGFR